MFFYGRIIIPLHYLSSKSRNSKVFTHSDFKMALSFAIMGSIAVSLIDKAAYKNIKPVRSRPGVLYRLGKVHKEINNGLPPFCPILSATGTPTYKLAKFL